jgi:hypothetical protein
MFCVAGVSGTCKVTTMSERSSRSSRLAAAARIAQRQLGFDVVIDHVHAQAFGQHADLGADVAVADRCPAPCRALRNCRRRISTSRRDGIRRMFFCGIPRISRMASAMTSSATLRVLE